MELQSTLLDSSLLQEEFIKVFKCYVSVIDAFKNRFTTKKLTNFDDIYFNQLKACKNIHNNWIIQHQFRQPEEEITKFYNISSLMSKMVIEYLETTFKEIGMYYEEFF